MPKWDPATTPHFTREEMQCRCGCGACEMDQKFMEGLEALRVAYGQSMVVKSGFRCPNHKDERQKAKPGAHAQGLAADIRCIDGGNRHRLVKLALMAGFQGVGVGRSFVHIDDGHAYAARPAIWTYS
ncbi:D-Ala-D-Ala carboxypeptidase family metallohydrolase [Pacificispira sp.]|uniref:D-Ala-D-Ala carboxypeptidase family metallohydrolase n=1 Tax=Pacificispira sp. TaxID=2888761 RepID=UPI003BA9180E